MKSLRLSFALFAATFALSLSSQSAAPQAAVKENWITLPSGVKYVVTKASTGPAIRDGQLVVFHQAGYSLDGKVLYSSWADGAPFGGTLGKPYVNPRELEEVFVLLRVGDRATVTIPSVPDTRIDVEMVAVKAFALSSFLQNLIDGPGGLAAARRRFSELKAANFPDCFTDRDLLLLVVSYMASYPKDRMAEALAVLQWAVELFPDYGAAYGQLGYYYVLMGKGDLAIRNYEKAIALNPQREDWQAVLAELRSGPGGLTRLQTSNQLGKELRAVYGAAAKGDATGLPAARGRLAAYLEKYPEAADGAQKVSDHLSVAEQADTKQVEVDAQSFLTSPNLKAREPAEAKLRLLALMKTPMQLKFTAADGRAVDATNLRGKVVLIDFWATWCGPCKEELPNVIANYQKYHDKGFDIVGIALEDGKLTPKDTPEQTTEKLAKAKKVLTDFTAKNEMPWPQYFDGKYWKNDISTKYAINSIPAMFLLDQDGKVVSTNARGPKLESEIKRLLKL